MLIGCEGALRQPEVAEADLVAVVVCSTGAVAGCLRQGLRMSTNQTWLGMGCGVVDFGLLKVVSFD